MLCCLALLFNATRHLAAQSRPVATAEGLWLADDGQHINCHGGNIIQAEDGTYCWYGEHRVENIPGASEDGIALYTSRDLKTWHYEGLVLQASPDTLSDIALGCIMERPKVVKTRRRENMSCSSISNCAEKDMLRREQALPWQTKSKGRFASCVRCAPMLGAGQQISRKRQSRGLGPQKRRL